MTGATRPDIPAATCRWRRKPSAPVDAIQWTGANFAAVKDFASGALGIGEVEDGTLPLWVVKSKAVCNVQRGDWIIREADGDGFYPCAADVFAATYEATTTTAGDLPEPAREAAYRAYRNWRIGDDGEGRLHAALAAAAPLIRADERERAEAAEAKLAAQREYDTYRRALWVMVRQFGGSVFLTSGQMEDVPLLASLGVGREPGGIRIIAGEEL